MWRVVFIVVVACASAAPARRPVTLVAEPAPATRPTYDAWWHVAMVAHQARGGAQANADEVIAHALENAVLESECDATRLGNIRLLAIAIRGVADRSLRLNVRLDQLADVGPVECNARITTRVDPQLE